MLKRKGRPRLTDAERANRKERYAENKQKRIAEREKLRQEEMKQYKPCPFCGSKDVEFVLVDINAGWVQCKRCIATGSYSENGKAVAIKLWNTREFLST